jgi:hypothetical protein
MSASADASGGTPNQPGDPFPKLWDGDLILGRDLLDILRNKYILRNLLRGGPIRQPSVVKSIVPNSETLHRLKNEQTGNVEDRTVDFRFVAPGDSILADSVGEQIVSGTLPLPLVFKPNSTEFGEGQGVVFFERAGEHIKVTFPLTKSPNQFEETKSILKFLGKKQIPASLFPQSNVVSATLPGNGEIGQNIAEILKLSSACHYARRGTYDPGMIESMLNAIKHHGKAYETRHTFIGNLIDGTCEPQRYEGNGIDAWYGRVGSSEYFSNMNGRPLARLLSPHEMFVPLYGAGGISDGQKMDFEHYIDALIRAEFRYVSERLKRAGLKIEGEVFGAFDLMWLPPTRVGEFPIPWVVEAVIYPQKAIETSYRVNRAMFR